MGFAGGWHGIIFMLAALTVLAFYIYIFVEKTNKKALLVSALILGVAAIINGFVALFAMGVVLLGASFSLLPAGQGLISFQTILGSIGGFFEELFRSVFVVLYVKIRWKYAVKKNKPSYSQIKDLDNQVFGLAFLYGGFESARMVYRFFPNLNEFFISKAWDFDILFSSEIFSIHPAYIIILVVGLVLRYYVHLRFLQFSVYALAAKCKMLYVLALLVHMATGLSLGYISDQSLHEVIVKMAVIEIIVVIVLTLLLKKLNLREQIIVDG